MEISKIRTAFDGYEPIGEKGYKHFAILVPVVGESLLYEVRASKLDRQPGEICFPGGLIEEGETPLECALRETEEEVGIKAGTIKVIAKLDSIFSTAGSQIHCFLGIVDEEASAAFIERQDTDKRDCASEKNCTDKKSRASEKNCTDKKSCASEKNCTDEKSCASDEPGKNSKLKAHTNTNFVPNDEVAETFTVEIDRLMREEPEMYTNELRQEPDPEFPYDRVTGGRMYPWRSGTSPVPIYDMKDDRGKNRIIWGLTGRITKQFLEVLKCSN